jgi:hypothetical protein
VKDRTFIEVWEMLCYAVMTHSGVRVLEKAASVDLGDWRKVRHAEYDAV